MLLELLKGVEDQRSYHGKEYDLPHILFFCLYAVYCKANTYSKIAWFIEGHFKELKEAFNLKWRRAPTINGLWKIIVGINAEELESVLRNFLQKNGGLKDADIAEQNGSEENERPHFCFDGKTLRGSASSRNGKKSLRIMEMFEAATQQIKRTIPLESEKDNEITVFLNVLKKFDGLKGSVVTADALQCQKKTVKPPKKLELPSSHK
jgi:hypothetical protein